MEKIDLKRELSSYRARRDTPELVDLPRRRYLMIDGAGNPNTDVLGAATSSLYPVAYGIKFAHRARSGRDHVVMPLEGLWWADDMASFTEARDKSRWRWTLMVLVPDEVTADLLGEVVERLGAKREPPARLGDVRLDDLTEGLCVQALHVGPFDDEAALLEHIHHEFVPAHGLALRGRHHEVYLSDPRRTAPARQRTILRQPVETSS